MDKKLAEYRQRKQREELIAKTKDKVNNFLNISRLYNGFGSKNNSKVDEAEEPLVLPPRIRSLNKDLDHQSDSEDEHLVPADDELDQINCFTYKQLVTYVFIFAIWASVYALFITWGFGSVYFVISALVGMYLNTRTKRKRRNEVSAYSVFNRNCESIKGAVKAEDLERQMIYGQIF